MSTLSIFDAAREAPEAIAFVTHERAYTFAEAAQACESRVSALYAEKPAALALRPRADAESLLWLYAAFACGTPVLLLHQRSTAEERGSAMALCKASEPPPLRAHALDRDQLELPPPTAAFAFIPTSGSSGSPRLVELSRAAVIASAAASAANLGWERDDAWLLCLPLAHTGGLSIVVRCLLARKTVLAFDLGEGGAMARVPELRRWLERATLVSLVPTLLDALLQDDFSAPPRLRAALIGGAGCSPELARRAHAASLPLLTSYGLTETASQVVTRPYAERYQALAEVDGVVDSGQPLPGVELRLEAGRIALRGPSLFTGYVGEGAATLTSDGFLLTNDQGVLGPRGELFVRGRVDDVIITGGENVDPLEVEAALVTLEGIRAACVFGSNSPQFGQVVVAAIITSRPDDATPQRLSEQLADRLARHKHPRQSYVLDSLPLTASGKVDRRACAALLEKKRTP